LIAKIALPNGAFITNTYDTNARMLQKSKGPAIMTLWNLTKMGYIE
jgi:hypothetical protein